jgi:hypothetical protein
MQSKIWKTNFDTNRDLEARSDAILDGLIAKHFVNPIITYDVVDDMTYATDATVKVYDIVFGGLVNYKISKRARRYNFIKYYSQDFTIRTSELPKILHYTTGPDYMFYTYLSKDETQCLGYYLIDLFKFRLDFNKWRVYREIQNKDGTTAIVIPVDEYKNCIEIY